MNRILAARRRRNTLELAVVVVIAIGVLTSMRYWGPLLQEAPLVRTHPTDLGVPGRCVIVAAALLTGPPYGYLLKQLDRPNPSHELVAARVAHCFPG